MAKRSKLEVSAIAKAHLDYIKQSSEPRPISEDSNDSGHTSDLMDNITIDPIPKRDLHPPGPHGSVCVDIVDLGMRVNDKYGKASQSVAFVFKTTKGLELSREFSVSLGDKSNLRKFLEAWRGKKFSPDELGKQLTLKDFHMKPAMVSIQHNPSTTNPDKVYANIDAIMPLPEGMPTPDVSGYVRAPFWETRKKEYADKFAAYMSAPPKEVPQDAPF